MTVESPHAAAAAPGAAQDCRSEAKAEGAEPVMRWTGDIHGHPVDFNDHFLAFTGRSLAEQCADPLLDLHDDDRTATVAARSDALRTRRPASVEYRLRRRDGAYRWMRETAAASLAADGSASGLTATCIDITSERSAASHARLLDCIVTVAAAGGSADDSFGELFKEFARVLGADCATAWTEEPGGQFCRLVDAYVAPAGELESFTEFCRAFVAHEENSLIAQTVFQQRVIAVPDLGPSSPPSNPISAVALKLGVTTLVLLPFAFGGVRRGVVYLFRTCPVDLDGLLGILRGLPDRVNALLDRKHSDDELLLLRSVLRHANDAVLIGRAARQRPEQGSQLLHANEALFRLTGYNLDDYRQGTTALFRGPFSNEQNIENIHRTLARGEPVRAVYPLYRKDAGYFWAESDMVPVFDDAGRYTHWLAVIRDITDRHRYLQIAPEREALSRALFDDSPVPMWVYDFETRRFLMVNQSAVRAHGFSVDQFLAMRLDDLYMPDEVDRLQTVLARPEAVFGRTGVWRLRRADGGEIAVVTASYRLEMRGRVVCLMGALDAAADRDHAGDLAVRMLLGTTEQQASVLDALPAMAALLDANGRILFTNKAWRNAGTTVTPYAGDHAKVGADYVALCRKVDRKIAPPVPLARPIATVVRGRRSFDTDYEGSYERNRRRWFRCIATAVESGGRRGAVVIHVDTTSEHPTDMQRALDSGRRQAAKMEALGTLAGGIAHDFNNLLVAMAGLLEMCLDDVAPDGSTARRLRTALAAVDQATDLVRKILAFSRRDEPKREPVSLAGIVGLALDLLAVSMPRSIRLERHLDDDGMVLADATQMHQVILNLGRNAIDAIDTAAATPGRIDVTVDAVELDAAERRRLDLAGTAYLRLRVADNGRGMPPEVRDRLFEPFFTTKPLGEGTGMGLAVVQGIVTDHGGAITVDSVPGAGTCFTVYLPRRQASGSRRCAIPRDEAAG
jgi:PAS domain S-box-containing protein